MTGKKLTRQILKEIFHTKVHSNPSNNLGDPKRCWPNRNFILYIINAYPCCVIRTLPVLFTFILLATVKVSR
jgi:hypothetical protein